MTDTGTGIEAEALPWIFDSPRRSRKKTVEGAGIGLALARGLCQAMGGYIAVTSEPGRGSTFTATVVLSHAPEETPVTEEGEDLPPRIGQRVLVVEDNTALRHLFSAWLRELDCEVVLASDGETALERTLGASFDAVLLDLGLPRLDGCEVARRKSLDAGMDVFLPKPVGLAVLAGALQRERAAGGGWTQRPLLRTAQTEALHAVARAETPAILEELRAAVAKADWKKTAATAHYLCNTADVLGAAEWRAACCDCESAARAGRGDEAAKAAAAVERLAVNSIA